MEYETVKYEFQRVCRERNDLRAEVERLTKELKEKQ